jgi:hypothetical protein
MIASHVLQISIACWAAYQILSYEDAIAWVTRDGLEALRRPEFRRDRRHLQRTWKRLGDENPACELQPSRASR